MEKSFIKLYRSLLDWEWYSDNNTKALFIHCLLKANFKDKVWRGVEIKRGSFLTSLDSLSTETGLSVQKIRTSLKRLKSTNELTSESNNQYRIITLNNYDKFNTLPTSQQATQQTANKQLTTTNNDKKEKKDIYGEFVKLTKTEYDKIITKYGLDILDEYSDRLNNYIGSTGKKYKSHYHTLLGWIRKDNVPTLEEKPDSNDPFGGAFN